jgi:hypothetical protein
MGTRNVSEEIEKKKTPARDTSGNVYVQLDVIEYDGEKIDLNYYFTQEYTDIGQAAAELPNLIEWCNWKTQLCYEDKLNAEQALAEAEANAFFDLKKGAYEDLYALKPTDAGIKHAINKDEGVIKAWLDLNRAAGYVRRFTALQNSLATKLDLIRSSEATRRRLVDPAELELDRKRGREDRDGE